MDATQLSTAIEVRNNELNEIEVNIRPIETTLVFTQGEASHMRLGQQSKLNFWARRKMRKLRLMKKGRSYSLTLLGEAMATALQDHQYGTRRPRYNRVDILEHHLFRTFENARRMPNNIVFDNPLAPRTHPDEQ